jgi:putative membrane protein
MFDYFIAAAPHTLLYLAVTLTLVLGFLAAYTLVTPLNEFKLIQEGKLAPAVSLIGALLGFVIPLSAVVTHSENILDVTLWGALVLAVQIAVFFVANAILGRTAVKIADNCLSTAAFTGGLGLAVGILMAGCLVP